MKKNVLLITIFTIIILNSSLFAYTISEEFIVMLQVNPYVLIETPEELNLYLFADNQEINTDTSEFSIRSNFALSLDIESGGFYPSVLNNYIRYIVDGEKLTPGTSSSALLTIKGSTYDSFTFIVELYEAELIENEAWEEISAITVSDTVILTVSAL
ncbi:hypothetical protein [Natronospora cellulosivora (SeqCode)]